MQNIFTVFTLFLLALLTPLSGFADPDPFQNHTWYRDNLGLTTTSHSPISMNGAFYDHSLSYQTPSGFYGQSDLCRVSSLNQLECVTNDTVILDPNTYAVTLNSSHGTYKYYDAAHPPQKSPISGVWKDIGERNGGYTCPGKEMDIPLQEYGVTQFNNITVRDSGGYSTMNTYYLIKYWDNKIYFTSSPNNIYMGTSFFLLDANNTPITELNNVDNVVKMVDFYSTSCILQKTSGLH